MPRHTRSKKLNTCVGAYALGRRHSLAGQFLPGCGISTYRIVVAVGAKFIVGATVALGRGAMTTGGTTVTTSIS